MKILMIGWGFPPRIQGGLDVHVHEICRELSKTNEVMLALPEFNSPGKNAGGIKIVPIKCRLRKDLTKTVSEYNRNIVTACMGVGFDVIHSHDWFGVEASERLRKEAGKPWVFTLHSLEYMRSCGTGKSAMERLERKGTRGCDRLVTVSRFMKKSVVKNYGIEPGKIEIVYNSASLGKGNPGRIRRKLGLGNKPMVLFIGRLSQQKGVEHLIYSAGTVLEKIPEARFVICGEGNLRDSLERFSSHMGLDGKVIFTGFVPEKELASYYSAADVFAYPSIFEPFGISVVESLLSGTPAITGMDAGVMEMLPGMASLKGVKPGDSRELAGRIVQMLKERRRVSEREKRVVARAYSWEKSAKEIAEIYLKVTKE
jgi:glycosyltransferase involved in cell wall biosynthesis